jgi:hypothetical protein
VILFKALSLHLAQKYDKPVRTAELQPGHGAGELSITKLSHNHCTKEFDSFGN